MANAIDTINGTALLLLDYQKATCDPGGSVGSSGLGEEIERRSVIPNAVRMLAWARLRSMKIVHIRLGFRDDYRDLTSTAPRFGGFRRRHAMVATSDEAAFEPRLQPADGESTFVKQTVNPFLGTGLRELLDREHVTHLLLGGGCHQSRCRVCRAIRCRDRIPCNGLGRSLRRRDLGHA